MTIFELSELLELNCANDKLVSIPHKVYILLYLKVLKANRNEISIFPDRIGKCRRLEHLILSKNKLSLLQDDFVECQKLRELNSTEQLFETILYLTRQASWRTKF